MKEFDKLFESEPIECLSLTKTALIEIAVFNVAVLLAKSNLHIVKNVAAKSFKRLNEDVYAESADIVSVPK